MKVISVFSRMRRGWFILSRSPWGRTPWARPGWVSVVLLFLVLALAETGVANSFPFRNLKPGVQVPPFQLQELQGRSSLTLDAVKGKPAVLVFWGADLPAKKKRSIKTLKALARLMPFFKARQVSVVLVNALGDDQATIDEVLAASKISLPVYLDPDRKVYGDLGIYVMPAVLLLDRNGKVAAGMGYSRELAAALKGELEVLLGEKTRAQVEQELHPETVEKSAKEKAADRHLHMAQLMVQRGMLDSAVREFEQALNIDASLAEAQVGLGCLFLDLGDLDKAQHHLDKGLTLDPESVPGQICDARLLAKEGAVDEALQDLEGLLLRNGRNAELRYVLGTLYEQKGQFGKAAREYRKAYELLKKQGRLAAGGSGD